MKNTSFNTHDIKKRCEKKLNIEFPKKKSKEFNGWYRLDNKKTARITIPKGRKFVPHKTYKSMATQLKLNVAQFDDLLECPLDQEGYEKILRDILE
jgi:hypothetical protein